MADGRTRRTGEYNAQIIKLTADAATMREHMDALEARVLRLEAELGARRSAGAPVAGAAAAVAPAPAPARPSKRPAPVGPPPLPQMPPVPVQKVAQQLNATARAGRRSIVDISEIAELVESIPPPPPRPRK